MLEQIWTFPLQQVMDFGSFSYSSEFSQGDRQPPEFCIPLDGSYRNPECWKLLVSTELSRIGEHIIRTHRRLLYVLVFFDTLYEPTTGLRPFGALRWATTSWTRFLCYARCSLCSLFSFKAPCRCTYSMLHANGVLDAPSLSQPLFNPSSSPFQVRRYGTRVGLKS